MYKPIFLFLSTVPLLLSATPSFLDLKFSINATEPIDKFKMEILSNPPKPLLDEPEEEGTPIPPTPLPRPFMFVDSKWIGVEGEVKLPLMNASEKVLYDLDKKCFGFEENIQIPLKNFSIDLGCRYLQKKNEKIFFLNTNLVF